MWPVGVKLLHGKRGRKGAIPDATAAEFERVTGWDWVGWATLMCHEKQTHQSKRRSLETLEDAQEHVNIAHEVRYLLNMPQCKLYQTYNDTSISSRNSHS